MKENKDILFILLFIFIIVGMAWQPKDKPATEKEPNVIATETSISQGETPEEQLQNINREAHELQRDVQAANEKAKRSPYYGKVSADISGVNSENPNDELITLFTNLETGEKVDITGWVFKSAVTGNYAIIGKAATLPYPDSGNEVDVILKQGDTVYIGKGYSPIGVSFRTNKCAGYFEENRTFNPSLSLSCPRAIDGNIPQFSTDLDAQEACLDAIRYIPTCSTRGTSYTRKLPDNVPSACKTYIQKEINYNSCVANHLSDADFVGHEYRLYFKTFAHLWRDYSKKDTIHLYDRAGLIVDTISY
jgi:hypothetical protein